MHDFNWDEIAMLSGLVNRVDLNDRAVRVIKPLRDQEGRLGVETMIGCKKLWVSPTNLVLIPSIAALKEERFAKMPQIDREDSMMFLHANEGSIKVAPGVRLMNTQLRAPQADQAHQASHAPRAPSPPPSEAERVAAARARGQSTRRSPLAPSAA